MPNFPTSEYRPGSAGEAPPAWRSRPILISVALSLAVLLLVRTRYRSPTARPATAPATEFSAVRAEGFLASTLRSGQPHPVGSAADAAMRQAILARLRSFGYQPHVEEGFACSYDGVCAQVQNVLARLDGSAGGKAVLLASHYDSVPAGPGASDDGAGVAAGLEIARIMKNSTPPRHPVIFLFDEGEEAGLLGAVAFIEQSPWARDVGAAVNLEARGTSGPGLMFETGGHSLWLMPLFARAVRRPLANSLFYAVYRRLPNDTDFSIFSRHGIDGFNFAFIGDVSHYHTPLDNLSHFDPGSLQSLGDDGLGAVRVLANADLGAQRRGEAVFFDLAGWKMIWWPVGWTVWLAVLALLLQFFCVWRFIRDGRLSLKQVGQGAAAWFLAVMLAALLALVLLWALREVGAVPSGWVAHPAALVATFWFLGIGGAAFATRCLARGAGTRGLWCGVWLCWAGLALIAALVMPEASFVWLGPALVAGFCGFFGPSEANFGWRAAAAAALPGLGAALLTFQMALLLYPALGATSLPIISALLASLTATFSPLLAVADPRISNRAAFGATAATVFLAVIAALLPPFSLQSPQRMNFVNLGRDLGLAGASDYIYLTPESGKLPQELARTGEWQQHSARMLPWSPVMGFRSKAEDKSWAPPVEYEPKLEIRSRTMTGPRLTITGVLQAGGIPTVAIAFPPEVKIDSFSMHGEPIPPLSQRAIRAANGWHVYACVTTPASGVVVNFSVEGHSAFKAALMSEWGWPLNWNPLPQHRPQKTVRSQSGDVYMLVYQTNLEFEEERNPESAGAIPLPGLGR